jgi:cation transport ATPase
LISIGVISFNLIISLIQEVRAKQTLDRITLLTRPKAVVLRDGREQPIAPEALVVGDILVMHPGDQIVVDGPLVGDGRSVPADHLFFLRGRAPSSISTAVPGKIEPGDRMKKGA